MGEMATRSHRPSAEAAGLQRHGSLWFHKPSRTPNSKEAPAIPAPSALGWAPRPLPRSSVTSSLVTRRHPQFTGAQRAAPCQERPPAWGSSARAAASRESRPGALPGSSVNDPEASRLWARTAKDTRAGDAELGCKREMRNGRETDAHSEARRAVGRKPQRAPAFCFRPARSLAPPARSGRDSAGRGSCGPDCRKNSANPAVLSAASPCAPPREPWERIPARAVLGCGGCPGRRRPGAAAEKGSRSTPAPQVPGGTGLSRLRGRGSLAFSAGSGPPPTPLSSSIDGKGAPSRARPRPSQGPRA